MEEREKEGGREAMGKEELDSERKSTFTLTCTFTLICSPSPNLQMVHAQCTFTLICTCHACHTRTCHACIGACPSHM